jgi:hypothetical protein
MTVKVVTQPDSLSATVFTFVVPAGEQWSLRSVNAFAARGAGGTPGRAYRLDITNGTNVVSAFGAQDAGTDPGGCEITWADCPAGADATGNAGIVSAPMKAVKLPTGYQIVGTITGAVSGDQWASATIWLDFIDSGAL